MKLLTSILFFAGVTAAFAQSFSDASKEAKSKLEAALTELNVVNQEISAEKPDLAATLDEVESEALRLRDEATNAARIKAGFDVEVSQLNKEKQSVIDTNNYLQSTLLNEYLRRLELTIDPSEIPLYKEQILETIAYIESEEKVDDKVIFENQLAVVSLSLDRVERLLGGYTFDSQAIVSDVITDGKFTLLGPVSYFSGDSGDSGIAGITQGMRNDKANIYSLPSYAPLISSTIASGNGDLPIDTTDGEALEGITHDITLLQEIALGGFVMYPILGLFALAILIATFKAIELFSVKPANSKDIDIILDHLRGSNTDAALAHAKSVSGPAGMMLCAAVENANDDREVIEEVLYESIIKTQPKLERFLAFIAVTAATAPLLGLLGTVTGMIKTFKLITIVGTGDAKSLSSGISEALITTKWGLIVAIPTLIMHALLNRKAKGVIGSMEQAAVGFMNGITEIRGESEKPSA